MLATFPILLMILLTVDTHIFKRILAFRAAGNTIALRTLLSCITKAAFEIVLADCGIKFLGIICSGKFQKLFIDQIIFC
jgi:hypothetical protein